MDTFFKKLKLMVTDRSIRNRLLFVLAMLVVFRFLATIPVPGVDTSAISQAFSNNQFLSLFNVVSGGGLSTFSIVMLGVSPYITASIIMQLIGMMIPSMKELMQESGEAGRRTFNQYTRLITVPISFLQGFAFIKYLQSQGAIGALSLPTILFNIVIITAGSMLLLWIGELINEFGVGNGTSMIILSGILAQIPPKISEFFFTFTIDQLPIVLLYLAIGLLVIAGTVFIYEAERPIKVTYARQVRGVRAFGGEDTYLPLRLTQAGVIPIIFASSFLLFPQFFISLFQNSAHVWLQNVATFFAGFLASTWWYSGVYFLLVVFFTYFYTAVTFDPQQISENLQKNGAFIPGTRPGDATNSYIGAVVTRITLVGSLYLGIIAVLPLIVKSTTGITAFAIGGTSLLITVSVIIDLIRRVDAQVAMNEY
ncbi:MAG TPA: preprotein translocase subunit SecY [Candidatus Paceibacterota bacterium]|jgi:preprotein translocase subunit SecY|nr:preprotein translocase subunit SecY [Candidatus Paceibacterota bacterium]